jgi:hypothetical protein
MNVISVFCQGVFDNGNWRMFSTLSPRYQMSPNPKSDVYVNNNISNDKDAWI